MRLMVYPRDSNPYQEALYDELAQLGVRRHYIGELTRSHAVNLALLPFELIVARLRGFRRLHLHWVFEFTLPVIGHHPAVRRLMRWYFVWLLDVARALGIGVVWTAHNILPHHQVFEDDQLGRRQLTARCVAVIAHSGETVQELTDMGCVLPTTAVIAPGPPVLTSDLSHTSRERPNDATFQVVFAGKLAAYKGVEELFEALATEEVPSDLCCVVAGHCADPDLARRLTDGAKRSQIPVDLRLSYLEDEEFVSLLATADAVVLPFRETTSSSSVLMALGAGTPVIIPDLPALADVPADCAWRYDGTLAGLAGALREAAATSAPRRAQMSAASVAHARSGSWAITAQATLELFDRIS
jgi:glycosyltransferase involved in cell wall biosynthesis